MLCDGELVGAHQLWERKGTPEWRTDISENHAEYRVDNAYKSASESWGGGDEVMPHQSNIVTTAVLDILYIRTYVGKYKQNYTKQFMDRLLEVVLRLGLIVVVDKSSKCTYV